MSYMFLNTNAFNQDLSSWDVSNVTAMRNMFTEANAFNQDLSSWNVSNVTDMGYMFDGADIFNQNLSSWNISSVSDVNDMFRDSGISISNYTKILLSWSQLTLQDAAGLGTVGPSSSPVPYCEAAQSARDIMTNTYNWSITDGGSVPCKTATYNSSTGGTLTGDTFQYIVDGQGGAAVTALPADGYRFVRWSDGSNTNPRTDSNLTDDLVVSAIFVSGNGGGEGTKIGVRAENITELLETIPVVGSVTKFVSSVRDFLTYLTEHEDELDTLTPEESSRLIVVLRDVLNFLLKLLPVV
jgi:surface protein